MDGPLTVPKKTPESYVVPYVTRDPNVEDSIFVRFLERTVSAEQLISDLPEIQTPIYTSNHLTVKDTEVLPDTLNIPISTYLRVFTELNFMHPLAAQMQSAIRPVPNLQSIIIAKIYNDYPELVSTLETQFRFINRQELVILCKSCFRQKPLCEVYTNVSICYACKAFGVSM